MVKLDICVFLHILFFLKKQYFKGHFDLTFSFLINIHRSGKQVDMAVCLSSFVEKN